MAKLFQRAWRVRVDDFQSETLDIAFEVEKTTKKEPNKCTLKLWNLTPEHRRQLAALSTVTKKKKSSTSSTKRKTALSGKIRVEVEAGYVGATTLIFRGDLRTAKSTLDGADYVTELEGEDGGKAVLLGRINRSFPPGTTVETVVKACAQAMDVGYGNAAELAHAARLEGSGGVFTNGTVLSGSAATELDHILKSAGLRYSIQNGNLQIQKRGAALQGTAVKLSPDTGLLGSPTSNADGTVSAIALMIPDLYPGRKVKFESVDFTGFYQIEKCKYAGDTAGDDWHVEMETKLVSNA